MVGHGGSSAGSYLADPTSPMPFHCAVMILFKSVPKVSQCINCRNSLSMILGYINHVCQPHSEFIFKDSHRPLNVRECWGIPCVCSRCENVTTMLYHSGLSRMRHHGWCTAFKSIQKSVFVSRDLN